MNILDWAKNKDEEKDFDTTVEEKKALPGLFDYVSFISEGKREWNSLSEEEQKGFSPFIINRALAMNPLFACLVADMQKYTMGVMPLETVYYLYYKVLPAKKYFNKWIKSKQEEKYGDELITAIANYFKESKKNAVKYLETMPEKELIVILEKFGYGEKEIEKLLSKPGEKVKKTKTTKKKAVK